jgi:hypothetical protein
MALDIIECCKRVSPCQAVCDIENALIRLGTGQALTVYRIGEESFQINPASRSDLMHLLTYFEGKCNVANGKPGRRRASVCFVPSSHTCNVCHRSACGCGR